MFAGRGQQSEGPPISASGYDGKRLGADRYLHYLPVEEVQRLRLEEDLRQALSSPAEREQAQRALQQIVQADGGVSPAEQAVVDEIQAALDQAQVGGLSSLLGFLARQDPAPRPGCGRCSESGSVPG